jgi:hypothetical protein
MHPFLRLGRLPRPRSTAASVRPLARTQRSGEPTPPPQQEDVRLPLLVELVGGFDESSSMRAHELG